MIFSNTTPFISLSAIDRLDLLPALFGRIHVVDAMVRECAAGGVIHVPALDTLSWITIVPSSAGTDPEPMLMQLDEGEKWTLHAARAANAERLLIDERIGRIVAQSVEPLYDPGLGGKAHWHVSSAGWRRYSPPT